MACVIPFTNFRGGPFGLRGGGGWRRGRHYSHFGPPGWLASRAGRPHHCFPRGPYPHGPWFNDIPHHWKATGESLRWMSRNWQAQPEWKQTVNCEGFTPDEIQVEISQGEITVEGLHESTGFNGVTSEVRQMKKTISIPEHVDSRDIKAFFKPNGVMVLKDVRKTLEHERAKRNESEKEEVKIVNKVCENPKQSNENKTTEPMEFQIILLGDLPFACEDITQDSAVGNKPRGEINEDTTQKTESRQRDEKSDTQDETKPPAQSPSIRVTDETCNQTSIWPTTLPKIGNENAVMNDFDPKAEEVKGPMEIDLTTEDDITEREFKFDLDMTKFNPESIEVRLKGDSLTVVSEQSEVDEDTGKVSSSKTLMKKLTIPADVNSDLLISK